MPTESSSVRNQSKLQNLGNSPGLWIFLFAGFGLVSLSLGEEKIQNRMLRHQYQAGQPPGDRSIQATDRQPRKMDSADSSAATGFSTPYQYRLTGLRWVLSIAAVGGFVSLVFTVGKMTRPNLPGAGN